MNTFKNWFSIIVVFCFLLVSCRTNRQVSKTEEQSTKKIEHKTTYSDTVFHTQTAKASLTIPISELDKCPKVYQLNGIKTPLKSDLKGQKREKEKPKIWKQKNGNASATVKIIHDSIFVTAQCDSLSIAAKIKKEFYKEQANKTFIDSKIKEQKPNFFRQLLVLMSAFFLGVIVGFILKTLLKITI